MNTFETKKKLALLRARHGTLNDDLKSTIRQINRKRKEITNAVLDSHLAILIKDLSDLEKHQEWIKEEHNKLREKLYRLTSSMWEKPATEDNNP